MTLMIFIVIAIGLALVIWVLSNRSKSDAHYKQYKDICYLNTNEGKSPIKGDTSSLVTSPEPDKSELHFDKGQDYLYNNDYHNAALYFEKAVKANPDHLDALKSL
ncbi:MAG: tetratricopeptide repeat protein, partial [Armatimonadota bacterium]